MEKLYEEKLSADTLLLIPNATYHQFYIRNQNQYTRLALTFPDIEGTEGLLSSTMNEIKIIRNLNSHMSETLKRMCQVIRNTNAGHECSVFLHGAFLMLLAELNMENVEITSPKLREGDSLITECYIVEKRLIYAHKLISENEKPTKIYLDCGYNDYPTFYKAYLKMFGYPPSGK